MPLNTELNSTQMKQFVGLLHQSLKIRSRCEFLLWSQGELQQFLPHDILIGAWGDFSSGAIDFEIVSAIPEFRKENLHADELIPFIHKLYECWDHHARSPFTLTINGEFFDVSKFIELGRNQDFRRMKFAIVHALKDARGWHDSLYILLSTSNSHSPFSRTMLEALLPYIDSSLRQIGQPPAQLEESEEIKLLNLLSTREIEIMEWVKNGKTNLEIGMILDISGFTVKNHLQRIFKKLDVINRAQAVAKLSTFVLQNAAH